VSLELAALALADQAEESNHSSLSIHIPPTPGREPHTGRSTTLRPPALISLPPQHPASLIADASPSLRLMNDVHQAYALLSEDVQIKKEPMPTCGDPDIVSGHGKPYSFIFFIFYFFIDTSSLLIHCLLIC
jgi:hypothetical protein